MRPCIRQTAILLLSSCAFFAGAQQAEIEDTRRNAIVRAIEKAAPTVVSVNVIVRENVPVRMRSFWDLYFEPAYREVNSVGSGFFFDGQGHILTNYHVIENADSLKPVTLPDGREVEVDFVGGDRRTDLAVLKAKGSNLPRVEFGDSEDLMIGEWVIAIGNPFGGLIQDPNPSVSVGVVSANHRRVNREIGDGDRLYQDLIQTDAAINPGNSGGPLVNARGQVVGVNTMIFSPSGGSVGLGFALPINRARRVAEEIIRFGRRRDPWPGLKAEGIASVRPDILRELGVRAESGCLVVNLLKSSPAYEAGLRPGDVITTVNGLTVAGPVELDFAFWSMFVGDTATVIADRHGRIMNFSFTIVEMAEP